MTSALAPRVRSKRSNTQTASTFRRDIQGIRAVAVIVVFLDHMLGWPAGGFVGVDMFFVISGFLITGLLLREYERTGHISASRFYIGRAKRIFPAATLVLLVTVAVAFLVFTPQRAGAVLGDAIAAFFFGANWNFAIAGTDYFQQGTALSPLQHYWSLSVEEQFYFVWPWLLLGLLVIFARFMQINDRRARFIAAASIGVISAVSFGWALIQAVDSPTVAYFSTFTRAWELGLGALVAIASPLFMRIPDIARTTLAYVGLIGMVASCFIITPETTWPAPWALLPTVATAIVIISGIGGEAKHLYPLTNPVSVYIGDISYSLYLWHFPVIVFGMALFPGASIFVYLGIAVAGFGLAIASYHAVEKPIWKSPLWVKHGRRAWRDWRQEFAPQIGRGLLVGLGVTTATLVALSLLPLLQGPPSYADSYRVPGQTPTPVATDASGEPVEESPALAALTQGIAASSSAPAWPALTPSLEEIGPNSRVNAWMDDGCLALERGAEGNPQETATRCVYGSGASGEKILLLGDSFGISWLPAVVAAYPDAEIHVMTMMMCPVSGVTVKKADGSPHPECDPFRDWTIEQAQTMRPSKIFIGEADNTLGRLVSGSTGSAGAAEISAGMSATLSRLAGASEHISILSSAPVLVSLEECYSATSSPADCVRSPNETHATLLAALRDSVASAGVPAVAFVDTTDLFCVDDRCPVQVDGIVARADSGHLTEEYSAKIGPALAELDAAARAGTP